MRQSGFNDVANAPMTRFVADQVQMLGTSLDGGDLRVWMENFNGRQRGQRRLSARNHFLMKICCLLISTGFFGANIELVPQTIQAWRFLGQMLTIWYNGDSFGAYLFQLIEYCWTFYPISTIIQRHQI